MSVMIRCDPRIQKAFVSYHKQNKLAEVWWSAKGIQQQPAAAVSCQCTPAVLAHFLCPCPAAPVLLQVYPKTPHVQHYPISYQQQQLSRCCSYYQQTCLR